VQKCISMDTIFLIKPDQPPRGAHTISSTLSSRDASAWACNYLAHGWAGPGGQLPVYKNEISKTGLQNSVEGARGLITWFSIVVGVKCASLNLRGCSIQTLILVGVIWTSI
jgi:hypothetical protein